MKGEYRGIYGLNMFT